ncbi:hypothetical protein C366_02390 [Cryptococcus neoformans Tu401-1]|nr:hypothetical protein C365_02534 [Cryptococcus neoformans var. grubii Bt85]OXC68364.1 hypothetical protein AYX13_03068 [Cryptococcus neoformans var. grubii]OXG19536.1 hypothetical protein C366_02390 [Cryptococcus neoformans var. grubii Tu401-1]OXM80044.1 hypothetical protein C364_02351 [Cryptococcus neoformans var. grubii Bt63]
MLIPTLGKDPNDPLNWSKGRKYLMLACVSLCNVYYIGHHPIFIPSLIPLPRLPVFVLINSMSYPTGLMAIVRAVLFFFLEEPSFQREHLTNVHEETNRSVTSIDLSLRPSNASNLSDQQMNMVFRHVLKM